MFMSAGRARKNILPRRPAGLTWRTTGCDPLPAADGAGANDFGPSIHHWVAACQDGHSHNRRLYQSELDGSLDPRLICAKTAAGSRVLGSRTTSPDVVRHRSEDRWQ